MCSRLPKHSPRTSRGATAGGIARPVVVPGKCRAECFNTANVQAYDDVVDPALVDLPLASGNDREFGLDLGGDDGIALEHFGCPLGFFVLGREDRAGHRDDETGLPFAHSRPRPIPRSAASSRSRLKSSGIKPRYLPRRAISSLSPGLFSTCIEPGPPIWTSISSPFRSSASTTTAGRRIARLLPQLQTRMPGSQVDIPARNGYPGRVSPPTR